MHTDPTPRPYRDRFHETLKHLEGDLQAQAAVVRAALARATRGLVTGNATLCGAAVAGDDEVDRQYLDIAEQVWFLVTGELVEFDSAPRVPAPEEQPVRS